MEKTILPEDWDQMERFYKRAFFNALSGYKNAALIGSRSTDGVSNLALFNSVVHIGANPPLLGFILRPTTVERHSYENLEDSGFYTINHTHESFYERAHQSSAKYQRQQSEFEAVGLHEQFTATHPAPYVKESLIKIGLQFQEEHFIQANGTRLIVGKIIEILIEDDLIEKSGHINLEAARSVGVVGLDTYFEANRLNRLEYAKP